MFDWEDDDAVICNRYQRKRGLVGGVKMRVQLQLIEWKESKNFFGIL